MTAKLTWVRSFMRFHPPNSPNKHSHLFLYSVRKLRYEVVFFCVNLRLIIFKFNQRKSGPFFKSAYHLLIWVHIKTPTLPKLSSSSFITASFACWFTLIFITMMWPWPVIYVQHLTVPLQAGSCVTMHGVIIKPFWKGAHQQSLDLININQSWSKNA